MKRLRALLQPATETADAGKPALEWWRERLRALRRDRIDIMAARYQLEDQIGRLRTLSRRADQRAARALRGGDEELARHLLTRKVFARRQMNAHTEQLDHIIRLEQRVIQRERELLLWLDRTRYRQRRHEAASPRRLQPMRSGGAELDLPA